MRKKLDLKKIWMDISEEEPCFADEYEETETETETDDDATATAERWI